MNASHSRILISPYRSARALPASARLRPAVLLVLSAGFFMAAGMLVSYLNRDYPPTPDVLKIWVDTWGEFLMLPFLKIPPESYRLFLAIIIVPLAFAIWMLMAGTAKLLSLLMDGHASYEQYLVITAFGFFPFWILAAIIDSIFSNVIDGYVLQAVTGQFGSFAAAFWINFPSFFYTILYGLGGLWIGIGVAGVESFKWWKAIPVALFSLCWPMLLMSVLMR
jgi:hypothetical protein